MDKETFEALQLVIKRVREYAAIMNKKKRKSQHDVFTQAVLYRDICTVENWMEVEALKNLWGDFGDVPIDENDNIDIDWHIWKKGTPKEDIWHWFDERSNGKIPPR